MLIRYFMKKIKYKIKSKIKNKDLFQPINIDLLLINKTKINSNLKDIKDYNLLNYFFNDLFFFIKK